MGLLGPGQTFVVAIEPPLEANEEPVVLTPNVADILMQDVQPDRVTLVNCSNRVVGYVTTVVPSVLVKAALVPWKRVIADLGTAVREGGLLERFAQLLK